MVINELVSEHETLTNTVCSDKERESIRKHPNVSLYTGKCWTVGIYLKKLKSFTVIDFETCTQDLTNIMNHQVPILAFLQWYFKESIDQYGHTYSINELVWCSQVIACFPEPTIAVSRRKSQLIDEIREHLIVKREQAQACSSITGIVILLLICSLIVCICT